MSHYVPGIGPPDAKIVFIGEAPGAEEDYKGEPFVGASGKELTRILADCGIDRQQCYLTNVVKERPPDNDFGVFYADPQRRQPGPLLVQSIQSLKEELLKINANIIVPLGGEALRALTGKARWSTSLKQMSGPITDWRGSLLHTPYGGKLCATFHPAHVLRQWTDRVTVMADMRRISKESLTHQLVLPQHTFEIAPTFERTCEYLRQRPKRLSFDIETSGPYVRCLGLSSEPHHAICIPFMSTEPAGFNPVGSDLLSLDYRPAERNSYWTPEQEHEILRLTNDLFADPSIKKVAQNFPFDALVIARDFGIDTGVNLWMDTMVAQHTCYSELPKGLDYLCSLYTRTPYYSDYDASNDRATWQYNCYDAAVTLEISYKLDQELSSMGISDFYHNHVNRALLAYTRAETRGLRIDTSLRKQISEDTHQEVFVLRNKIEFLSDGQIKNPRSPKQVKDYVYNTLGLPIQFSKTETPTLGEHARETLSIKHPEHSAFFEHLDAYSKKSSLISRLLDRELGADGRLRTHLSVSGTVNGRLSSSEPLFEVGTNLQNIDRGVLRRLFIADPGWCFIKADLSQAQWRIVVWKGGIRRIIEQFNTNPNYSVHRWLASLAYSKPEAEVGKGTQEYDVAKNGVYAGMFGVFERTFHKTINLGKPISTHISFSEAKHLLDTFHLALPEIKQQFHRRIQDEINTRRKLVSPLGRVHIFYDRLSDSLYRDAYAGIAQMVEADVIHQAAYRADRDFDSSECHLLLQIHDELLFHCREDLAVRYATRLKELMEIPVQFSETPEPLIIPADVSIGPNWYDQTPLSKYKEAQCQAA